jgi:adenine phosphoribosyltransferase
MGLEERVRNISDFPITGIQFKDITPLLRDPRALREAIDRMAAGCAGMEIDCVVGIESRGFILGAPLAYLLDAGFVPVRKPGKLPAETVDAEYTLEYGVNRLEMHRDAIEPGQRVLVVDDLLATGGSARAAAELVESVGGVVAGMSFLVELSFLRGRDRLADYDVRSLITYKEEC